jgi:Leucine rich repeat
LVIGIQSERTPKNWNRHCWYYDQRYNLECNYQNIPDNFFNKNFRWLRSLSLTNNKIRKLSAQTFGGLIELKRLYLDDNEIPDLPHGVFKPLKSIEYINLPHNNLSSIDFDQFADNQLLQKINLEHNSIEIVQPIQHEGGFKITELWLNDNKLVNIAELCKVKSLTSLDLSNNPNLNFKSFNFNCWRDLERLHLENTNLQSLNNDYQSFDGLTKLTYLNLVRNELSHFCVVNFPGLPALEHLDIKDNKLQTLNVTELKIKFKNLAAINLSANLWNCTGFFELKAKLNDLEIMMIEEQVTKCSDQTSVVQKSEKDSCKIISRKDTFKKEFYLFYLPTALIFILMTIDICFVILDIYRTYSLC